MYPVHATTQKLPPCSLNSQVSTVWAEGPLRDSPWTQGSGPGCSLHVWFDLCP